MFGPQKRVGAENSIAADHQGKRDSLKELAELKPRAKVRVPSGGAVDRHQNTWDRNAPIASVSYQTQAQAHDYPLGHPASWLRLQDHGFAPQIGTFHDMLRL